MKGEPVQKANAEKSPQPAVKVLKQVRLLPEGMQMAIRELLVLGSTIESTVQSVNGRDDWDEPAAETGGRPVHCHITRQAVQEFYAANPPVQRERAHYLVDNTESITRSLGKKGDAEDGEARYVQAVVMTGLTRLNDKDAPLSVKEALRARAELCVLYLKKKLAKLKETESMWHRAYEKSQKALVEQRKEFVFEQTVKLRDMMRKLEKKKNLTPETLEKIQETYGILAEHVADPLFFSHEDDVKDPREELKESLEEHFLRGQEEEKL